MKVRKLLKGIDFICDNEAFLDIDVSDISYDSRYLKDNSVFVAYKGTAYDSHRDVPKLRFNPKIKLFVTEKRIEGIDSIVVDDGRKALAVMSKNLFVGEREFNAVGITGTNGKSTVLYLINHILEKAGFNTIRIGTVNYKIGNKVKVAENTTPGAYSFFKMIGEGLDEGCNWVLCEVSSHALHQHRIYGMKFDYAVFTNLSGDHLDYHTNMSEYFEAKSMLFTPKYLKKEAVVNIDDEYGIKLTKNLPNDKVVTYAVKNSADLFPENLEMNLNGSEFVLNYFGNKEKIETGLVGKHNIYNLLAAIGVSLKIGLEIGQIKEAVRDFTNVPGRLEKIVWNERYFFIDYAHTHDALENVLKSLVPYRKSRIITLFGCGGNRDKSKRPKMGCVAESYSDIVIVTSDNPRDEEPMDIINDILAGIRNKERVIVIEDRREAIKYAVNMSKKGDIILIAGKGHEDYQVVKGKKLHFDDKEEVLSCCEAI